ncbi:competence protein ComER [Melghirimyces profundicolus]|uniref:Pyrroline-5-carboxylate reductase n=1 Tax=Melghirimyces profundicolus TaxID=1242148 RepID=A0A2T6C919_9BACL|nr:late competence protein ComER [Melghirimyces profundicolus]PTX64815.1 competence protein ComER [Melghirimyces profundicolus]
MIYGFIGTGNMGRTLIEAFIRSGKLKPSELIISNRTKSKAEALAKSYPGLRLASDNRETVRNSDVFFLCIKPGEFRNVLDEIRDAVREDQIAVSITSPVMVADLEAWLSARIAKIIPSIANAACAGNSLFIPGSRLTRENRDHLRDLFGAISQPLMVEEVHTRVASDLACCAPAFMAHLMEKLADAAVEETGLPRETALSLVTRMAEGLGRLLTEGGFTLETLQERVAVPGGITREGLNLLQKDVGPVFNELIRLTHAKYEDDIEKVQNSLFPKMKK